MDNIVKEMCLRFDSWTYLHGQGDIIVFPLGIVNVNFPMLYLRHVSGERKYNILQTYSSPNCHKPKSVF